MGKTPGAEGIQVFSCRVLASAFLTQYNNLKFKGPVQRPYTKREFMKAAYVWPNAFVECNVASMLTKKDMDE